MKITGNNDQPLTDDLVGFRRSKVKVTQQAWEDVNVDAGASQFSF